MHICKNEGSYVGLTCSLACSCCTTALCAEVAPAGIYSVSLAVQKFSLLTILSHSRSKFVSLTDPLLLLLHTFIYLFLLVSCLFWQQIKTSVCYICRGFRSDFVFSFSRAKQPRLILLHPRCLFPSVCFSLHMWCLQSHTWQGLSFINAQQTRATALSIL